ncbi:MAG: amidase family protein [Pseudomonadota bacterium]
MDLKKSAAEQGRDIGAGRTDPVELAEALFDAITSHPARDDVYARLTFDRARAEAEAARARALAGTRRGLLDGVPISWKDLFDTADVPTESGSPLLAGRVPTADAPIVELGAMAGLVTVGKTHQTELAFSGIGINRRTATPPNVHGADLAPGGSSSGAAVSVALGLASVAMGSDTGGSSRVPPAWNDLVGLKPAHGSLSLEGVVPLAPRFDTPGPIGRTVEDVAHLYAALRPEPVADLAAADVTGRLFVVLEAPSLPAIDEAPAAAHEAALAKLSAAGARVETRTVDAVSAAMALAGVLYTTEAYAVWGREIEARGDVMDPRIRARFEQGLAFSGVDYVRAWAELEDHRRAFRAAMADADAVVLPTVPILPPSVELLLEDDAYFTARNLETLRNTRVGNLMELVSLSVPTGVAHCGLMLMVPPGQAERLFRLGHAVERVLAA